MSPVHLTTIVEANSTTYADELGVLIGLSRLPGETSERYLKRLKTATRIDVSQGYVGLLNEITLQLGLKLKRMISLTSMNQVVVNVSIAGVVLTQGVNTQTIPLVTLDVDDAWTWRKLSDIVSDINAGSVSQAELVDDDAPSIVLAKQSNILTVIAQPVQGQDIDLGFTGIIVGSERFNAPVPMYTLLVDGSLTFEQPVPSGTTITYQRQVWPYQLIGGDAALIGLIDPKVAIVSEGPNGNIVYQIREVVQSILSQDRSYWSR
jgi:hypothetical protein